MGPSNLVRTGVFYHFYLGFANVRDLSYSEAMGERKIFKVGSDIALAILNGGESGEYEISGFVAKSKHGPYTFKVVHRGIKAMNGDRVVGWFPCDLETSKDWSKGEIQEGVLQEYFKLAENLNVSINTPGK